MFGKVVYCDKGKIIDYTSIITGKPIVESSLIHQSTNKEAQLNVAPIAVGASSAKTYEFKTTQSNLHTICEFEKRLEGRDDYFDFTTNANFCLDTIQRGNIVKFASSICVSEKFDMIQMIDKFKPMLLNDAVSTMQKNEADAFKTFFNTQSAKIPLMCNIDVVEVRALIETTSLEIDYEDIDDYEEVEMSILARTLDNGLVSKEKPFFEPLKHFIKLNRTMRRTMSKDATKELSPIFSDEDYRLFEIIAIYG